MSQSVSEWTPTCARRLPVSGPWSPCQTGHLPVYAVSLSDTYLYTRSPCQCQSGHLPVYAVSQSVSDWTPTCIRGLPVSVRLDTYLCTPPPCQWALCRSRLRPGLPVNRRDPRPAPRRRDTAVCTGGLGSNPWIATCAPGAAWGLTFGPRLKGAVAPRKQNPTYSPQTGRLASVLTLLKGAVPPRKHNPTTVRLASVLTLLKEAVPPRKHNPTTVRLTSVLTLLKKREKKKKERRKGLSHPENKTLYTCSSNCPVCVRFNGKQNPTQVPQTVRCASVSTENKTLHKFLKLSGVRPFQRKIKPYTSSSNCQVCVRFNVP